MTNLTPAQLRVLAYIAMYTGCRHYPPTYEDIMRALGISSKSLIVYYLRPLLAAELLTQQSGEARTVVVTPAGADVLLADWDKMGQAEEETA